jgi:serine/threonine protein kinase
MQVLETSTKVFIILEYLEGDLLEYIENEPLDEASARIIFIQIATAVEACHRATIVHRCACLLDATIGASVEWLQLNPA